MKYLLLFLAFFLSTDLVAQITITSSDFIQVAGESPNRVSYSSSDLTGLQALVAASGPSQSWDFGGRVYTEEQTSSSFTIVPYPGGAALADDPAFQSSTHVMMQSIDENVVVYSFVKLETDGFFSLGMTQDSFGVKSKIFVYDPPVHEMKFPATYQTTWSSTSTITNLPSPVPGIIFRMKIDGTFDAWGTLVTPTRAGKAHTPVVATEALRLKMTRTFITDFNGNVIAQPVDSYHWYTKSSYSASIGTDMNGNPTHVSYTMVGTSGVEDESGSSGAAIQILENPASNTSTFAVTVPTDGEISLAVMDVLGREVRVVHSGFTPTGTYIYPFTTTDLSAGPYFVRLTCGKDAIMKKFIIAR